MCVCVCITESLCCTLEATLQMNYTAVKKEKKNPQKKKAKTQTKKPSPKKKKKKKKKKKNSLKKKKKNKTKILGKFFFLIKLNPKFEQNIPFTWLSLFCSSPSLP